MTNPQVSRLLLCHISLRMFCSFALPVLVAFSAVGCGAKSGLDRKPVYGKIAGAEGREGNVTYTPKDPKLGQAATLSFEDSAYQFTEEGGPIPGEYIVRVELATLESIAAGRRLAYEPGKYTKATVPTDGPFEIDLNPK